MLSYKHSTRHSLELCKASQRGQAYCPDTCFVLDVLLMDPRQEKTEMLYDLSVITQNTMLQASPTPKPMFLP